MEKPEIYDQHAYTNHEKLLCVSYHRYSPTIPIYTVYEHMHGARELGVVDDYGNINPTLNITKVCRFIGQEHDFH